MRLPVRGRFRFADVIGRRLAPAGVETIDLDGIPFPVDHSLAPYRYAYYGVYEEDNVRLARKLVRPGDTVIDAGAKIGYLTTVFAALVGPNGRVFAFEPSRNCSALLSFLDLIPNVEVSPRRWGRDDDGAVLRHRARRNDGLCVHRRAPR